MSFSSECNLTGIFLKSEFPMRSLCRFGFVWQCSNNVFLHMSACCQNSLYFTFVFFFIHLIFLYSSCEPTAILLSPEQSPQTPIRRSSSDKGRSSSDLSQKETATSEGFNNRHSAYCDTTGNTIKNEHANDEQKPRIKAMTPPPPTYDDVVNTNSNSNSAVPVSWRKLDY